jgi:hypothetical protein
MFRSDARGRLSDKIASYLRGQLPGDFLVLSRYAPRDGGDRVPLVIIGRSGLVIVEPRDDDGAFVCYQDHWYKAIGVVAHPLGDAPSLRARDNGIRVKRDLGTGGFINVKVDALVLLTKGEPVDVRSSCVPVIAGLDPLVRHLLQRAAAVPAPEDTHALAEALAHPIKLSLG